MSAQPPGFHEQPTVPSPRPSPRSGEERAPGGEAAKGRKSRELSGRLRTVFGSFLDRERKRFPFAGDMTDHLAEHRADPRGLSFPAFLVDGGFMEESDLRSAIEVFRARGGPGGAKLTETWRLVQVSLVLDEGKSDPAEAPVYELELGKQVLLGRRTSATEDVDWDFADDKRVSRRQCRLSGLIEGVEVTPLGDANPVRLNGKEMPPERAVLAGDGDLLRVGETILQVRSALWDEEEELRYEFRPCPRCGFRIRLADVLEGRALGRRGTYYHEHCYREAADLRHLGIPGYELREWIGGGGMGNVYLAWHKATRSERAVKLMRPEVLAEQPRLERRFVQEAEAWGRLGRDGGHPGIVRLLDAHTPDSGEPPHYLVLEYVDGRPLSAALRKEGKFSVAKAVSLGLQLARALEHAYALDVLHRDLKPDNILLDRNDRPRVTDWGLGRIARETACQVTRTRTGMGTPGYAPPEQWDDMHACDVTADIYGLGATMYQLLAGKPPYAGLSLTTMIREQKAGPPPPLRERQEEVPPALDQIIRRCLEPDRRKRYATPGELARGLAKL